MPMMFSMVSSLFYPENGGNKFLRNLTYLSNKLHSVTSQEREIFILGLRPEILLVIFSYIKISRTNLEIPFYLPSERSPFGNIVFIQGLSDNTAGSQDKRRLT
jgi:hypothetical protein